MSQAGKHNRTAQQQIH